MCIVRGYHVNYPTPSHYANMTMSAAVMGNKAATIDTDNSSAPLVVFAADWGLVVVPLDEVSLTTVAWNWKTAGPALVVSSEIAAPPSVTTM